MPDPSGTKHELTEEQTLLTQKITELAQSKSDLKRVEEEKRRNQETAERLAEEMAIIAEIGRVVGSTLDISQVFERVDAEVRKLISYDRLVVNLKKDDNEFVIAYASGVDSAGGNTGNVYQSRGTTTRVVMTARTGILIQPADAEEIKHLHPNQYASFKTGLRSTMSVPLISLHTVIGAMTFRSKKLKAYTEQDLHLAERIGAQVAGAIANARLHTGLKKMERELRESEARFRELYEMAPVGYQEYDAEGRITRVNQTELDLLGYSREEMIGRYIWTINWDEEVAREQILAKLAGELPPGRQLERAYRRKDGTPVPVLIEDRLITDERGGIKGIRCTIQNITERKRMEDELTVITEVGRLISSTLNIEDVYERFAAEVRKLIHFDRIQVNLKNPDGESFSAVYVSGVDIAVGRVGNTVPLAGSMTGFVCATRIGLRFHPVSEEEIVDRFSGAFAVSTFRAGMRSMMAVPLISRDEVIGTLHFRAKKPNAYTEGDLRLAERIGAQIAGAVANAQLFEELKKTKDRLQDSEKELRRTLDNLEITITQRTVELEETNTALRVLLKKGDKDQRKLEETLQSNVNQLVTPFLSKLRVSQSTEERQTYVNILKTNLNNITSPFINHLSVAFKNLTPKEIQIAELIKQGKRSKEIAELFGVSVGTVITHRNNIRKKLKLKSRDANLRSHLLSLA